MIESTGLKRKTGKVAQNGLLQAIMGGSYSIVQTDQLFTTKPFLRSCEYFLPSVFDILACQQDSTRLRNTQIESAR